MSELFNFMNSASNRRQKNKQAMEETEKKKEVNKKAKWALSVPRVILIVANLIVLTLDYRVLDVAYRVTESYILTAFSIIPTGLMFVIWFDLVYSNYPLATPIQKRIALAGAGLSLLTGIVFSVMEFDFIVSDAFTLTANYKFVFWATIILSVIHAVTMFWWYAIDEETEHRREDEKELATQRRNAEQQVAQTRITLEMIDTANQALERLQTAMKNKQVLEDLYGKAEVDKMLAMLSNVEIATGKDLDGNGKIGTVDAGAKQYQSAAPAVDANFTDPSAGQTKRPTR